MALEQQERPAIFDEATWAELPALLGHLSAPVHLQMWGDVTLSEAEAQTAVLLQTLADHFDLISFQLNERKADYPYYPVVGIWGEQAGAPVDYGVRIIGWPAGSQLTSLLTGIQVVAFQGQTLEPKTRVQLKGLTTAVTIEMLSSADNEAGAIVAQIGFGLAVASPHIKSFLIMADQFPTATVRYSAQYLPHTVINGRVHINGVTDETTLMQHIAQAIKRPE